MLLSIIIPMYNGEMYIADCISSILSQGLDNHDYEIIVIDDGSSDCGIEKVKELSNKNDNIRFYRQTNRGLPITRNTGLRYAQGDWVHFVDCDDEIPDGAYLKLFKNMTEIKQTKNVDIISFKTKTFENGRLAHAVTSNDGISFEGSFYDYVSRYGFRNPVWGYWLRRDFIINKSLKFKNVSYAEDNVFNIDLFHYYNSNILVFDIIAYHHIIRQDSITTTFNSDRLENAICDMADIYNYLIEKMNHSRYSKTIFNPLLGYLPQRIFTRMLMGEFKKEKRCELIQYCKERGVLPSKNLQNSIIDKIGNFLICYSWLMPSASVIYRKVFIPYFKPHIDLYTGRFVFKKK